MSENAGWNDKAADGDDFSRSNEPATGEEKLYVEREREELKKFVKGLTADDIKSGNWFGRLLAHALATYTTKVDWQYFQQKYDGVPADAIVEQRIRLAARYAALEGAMSASGYSALAISAAPLIIPAGATSAFVDLAFTAQLQIRLAYDISVLYRVPIDIDDAEDLSKLIRVAFTIKGGEVLEEGLLKVVPAVVKPLVKAFYKKETLAAARALPVVGKYLLQRNVVKIGIPVVGIPLATVLNHYTTVIAGRHARAVFRNDARIIELASVMSAESRHPQLMLWVAWVMVVSDGRPTGDESVLMRHLVQSVKEHHQVVDEDLARVVDVDRAEVLDRVRREGGDRTDLVDSARRVAGVDGRSNAAERSMIEELEAAC